MPGDSLKGVPIILRQGVQTTSEWHVARGFGAVRMVVCGVQIGMVSKVLSLVSLWAGTLSFDCADLLQMDHVIGVLRKLLSYASSIRRFITWHSIIGQE